MAAIGVDAVGTTPAAYAKIISDDYAWGKVIAAAPSIWSLGPRRLLSPSNCVNRESFEGRAIRASQKQVVWAIAEKYAPFIW
jgi:hypothetical protein